jgi:hypothetical protein
MATRAKLIELMRECDHARYLQPADLPRTRLELREAVWADQGAALALIDTMEGCPRTVRRHRQYLRNILGEDAVPWSRMG